MSLWTCFGVACLAAVSVQPSAAAEPDAAAIVRRSVEANVRNYAALPHFNYFKMEQGRDGTTRTYEEIMLFGSRYSRLTAVNGEPLSAERQKEEQRKLEAATQKRARESTAERASRVSGYERERERDQLLLNEMAKAFEFTLTGEETLGGHDVYVLKARPRAGYRAPNSRAKVLTGMEGTLWIEKTTFQWVRVEAEVIHAVSIEGFLARVLPGTRFALEQAPVAGDLWLPTHFTMRARARILFLFSKSDDQDETYSGYTPATTVQSDSAADEATGGKSAAAGGGHCASPGWRRACQAAVSSVPSAVSWLSSQIMTPPRRRWAA